MTRAIGLNDERKLETDKVGDEAPEWNLTPELRPFDTTAAQHVPQHFLRRRRSSAQLSSQQRSATTIHGSPIGHPTPPLRGFHSPERECREPVLPSPTGRGVGGEAYHPKPADRALESRAITPVN